MNTLSLQNLLLSLPLQGLLWFLFLIVICSLGVHITQLARLGWAYKTEHEKKSAEKQKPQPEKTEKPKEEKKAPAETPQEPIYYIVEKKRGRSKATYGEPKQITFKP